MYCQQGKPSGQVNVSFGREELFDADPMVCQLLDCLNPNSEALFKHFLFLQLQINMLCNINVFKVFDLNVHCTHYLVQCCQNVWCFL